jgi:hypothetical protein
MNSPDKSRAGGSSAARAVPPHMLAASLATPRQRPAEALEALAAQIPEPGRFYVVSDGMLAVLSLSSATIWCNGRAYWWATPDGEVTWPAADSPGAARRLAPEDGS